MIEDRIKALVERLTRIAQKNGDDFEFKILIQSAPVRFEFIAFERADRHCFVSGRGRTITDAVIEADNSITSACETWGYENL